MKIKTTDLIGPTLDWAVDKCEEPVGGYKSWYQDFLDKGVLPGPRYSTDWANGGPIIEREIAQGMRMQKGMAFYYNPGIDSFEFLMRGPTPLIAAMRCYVASKLGDEVEVPDALFAS